MHFSPYMGDKDNRAYSAAGSRRSYPAHFTTGNRG
jgi:hypothetical protein